MARACAFVLNISVSTLLLVVAPAWSQGGCDLSQITSSTSSSGNSFDPSLDDGSIAFRSAADLTGGSSGGVFELFFWDGSTITQISSSISGSSFGPFAPSLDGGPIAFSYDDDLTGGNPEGNREIFFWDGSTILQITSSTVGGSSSPSLDGGSIAFSSDADLTGGNADGNLEVFFWDGSTITQISGPSSADSFDPSLDGGSIAFTSDADLTGGNSDGSSEIFLWDGSTIHQITDATSGASFDPSLDGGSIAFVSSADLTGGNSDGSSEIFLWDGSTTTQITDSTSVPPFGGSREPSLHAGAIAFDSATDLTGENPDGNREIFFWDGLNIVQVTDSTSSSTPSGSFSPSLDGGAIAFHSHENLTGGNPEGNAEIFLATCSLPAPSVLEIPVLEPTGMAALTALLLGLGMLLIRRHFA